MHVVSNMFIAKAGYDGILCCATIVPFFFSNDFETCVQNEPIQHSPRAIHLSISNRIIETFVGNEFIPRGYAASPEAQSSGRERKQNEHKCSHTKMRITNQVDKS